MKHTILNGWPQTQKDLPNDIKTYWKWRHELAVEAGVIFRGRQIMIPPKLQSEMNGLHQGHQGIEKKISQRFCVLE